MMIDDKIDSLEERLDIILLTMNVGVGGQPKHYEVLDRLKSFATMRQRRRDEQNGIKEEYWKLKQRMREIETDYPDIVK